MKEFRKTENGLFICEECGRTFENLRAFSLHLYLSHNGKEVYFKKWLKDENDICVICGNNVKFKGIYGCEKTCSKKCAKILTRQTNIKKYGVEFPMQNKEIIKKSQDTCVKKYGKRTFTGSNEYKKSLLKNFGVENNFQRKDIKEKCIQTNLKNLGVKNPSQSDQIKKKKEQTCIKNHGVKSGLCLAEKVKKGNIQNNGVEYPMQSIYIREKSRQTCLLKYGVEYIHQNKQIHEKSQKTAKTLKQYKNTNIWYRGSYELDFLEKYYNMYPDIQNASSIKYVFNNKKHVYHPDFYIPSLNLIIECKNSYLAKKDKQQILAKKNATITNNFQYLMILNKDYIEFEQLKNKSLE